ncbi:interleukin-17 receptor A [Kryptolebias marmoratus]|uniref:interleukin-17 receptor A n=1 Tax=Kryptolebias marmoratus TaxID=37003 RepID=UPI0007F876C2|nr:interleukin-17 receptor A [Kryptolebias marmoratus]
MCLVKMALLRTAVPVLVLVLCATLSSALDILSGHALNCSRQDLNCTATQRSINYLKATELHVLVFSTNENRCIRYSFQDKLQMRSPSGEKWLFSTNVMVLQPSQEYMVSVFNIPKPEQGHTNFDVNKTVLVADCQDPNIKRTQFCLERGSDWQPNIAVTTNSSLDVSFRPHVLSEKYMVIVSCVDNQRIAEVEKIDQMSLNVTFSLNLWPKSCCKFNVMIKPFFPECGGDCTRQQRTANICSDKKDTPPLDFSPYIFVAMGVVTMCVLLAVSFFLCKKKGRPAVPPSDKNPPQPPKTPPKVLVIYSQDHRLYRDVVLKLCAFLQAKCGTRVLVDLLDATSVGMVGRVRWLEWQRQRLKSPCDKILVLCSRGVQAKWRAMCGQGPVLLREDVLSPTDDMFVPFLNLFLPDLHQAGTLGKYMVAYFEDISSEQDVPSVFDIGVKYTLMKHFEELYFRILDIEKYQPGQVNHIEGVGGDEYFNCPSGRALKDAIATFQAYQLETPDWFEKECVPREEEVVTEARPLIDPLQTPQVFECVLPIGECLPVFVHGEDLNETCGSVHVLMPDVKPENQAASVAELLPVLNPDWNHRHPLSQVEVLADPGSCPQSIYIAEPVLNNQSAVQENWLSLREHRSAETPTEDDEEESLLSMNNEPSARSVLQNSVNSTLSSRSYFPSPEISVSQPVELEEDEEEEEELREKRSSSGSDQGYISKTSSEDEAPSKEDPLVTLAKLQEELLRQNLDYSYIEPEEN